MDWNQIGIIPVAAEKVIMQAFPAPAGDEQRCKQVRPAKPSDEFSRKIDCGRELGHSGPCINYYGLRDELPFIAWGNEIEVLVVMVRMLV